MTTTHLLTVDVHHGRHRATATCDLDLETGRPTHEEIVADIAAGIRRAREADTIGAYVPSDDTKVRDIAERLTYGDTEHGWVRYAVTEV